MHIRRLLAALALAVASVFFVSSAATAVSNPIWDPPVVLETSAARSSTQIASSGANTMAAWRGGTNGEKVFSKVSYDGGATWEPPVEVMSLLAPVVSFNLVPLSGGKFGLIAATDGAVSPNIKLALSSADGTVWPQTLTQSSPDAVYDVVATEVANGRIAIAARIDVSNVEEIQVAVTDSSNSSLSGFTRVSAAATRTWMPRITYSSGVLAVSWAQNNTLDLASNYSTNLGTNWHVPESMNVSSTVGVDKFQALNCGGQLLLLPSLDAAGGFAKLYSRPADFSTPGWGAAVVVSAGRSTHLQGTCLKDNSVLLAWASSAVSSKLMSTRATLAGATWTLEPTTEFNSVTTAVSLALAATPDGGAGLIASNYSSGGSLLGHTWSATSGWSTGTVIDTAPSGQTQSFIAGTSTSSGAAYIWSSSTLPTLIPTGTISALRLYAPTPPTPTPTPDPALADTGAQAALSTQLGGVALALGVLVLGVASVRRLQGRAVHSRARAR